MKENPITLILYAILVIPLAFIASIFSLAKKS